METLYTFIAKSQMSYVEKYSVRHPEPANFHNVSIRSSYSTQQVLTHAFNPRFYSSKTRMALPALH